MNIRTNSLRAVIAACPNAYPEKFKWRWNEQVCRGVMNSLTNWIPRYIRTYLYLLQTLTRPAPIVCRTGAVLASIKLALLMEQRAMVTLSMKIALYNTHHYYYMRSGRLLFSLRSVHVYLESIVTWDHHRNSWGGKWEEGREMGPGIMPLDVRILRCFISIGMKEIYIISSYRHN